MPSCFADWADWTLSRTSGSIEAPWANSCPSLIITITRVAWASRNNERPASIPLPRKVISQGSPSGRPLLSMPAIAALSALASDERVRWVNAVPQKETTAIRALPPWASNVSTKLVAAPRRKPRSLSAMDPVRSITSTASIAPEHRASTWNICVFPVDGDPCASFSVHCQDRYSIGFWLGPGRYRIRRARLAIRAAVAWLFHSNLRPWPGEASLLPMATSPAQMTPSTATRTGPTDGSSSRSPELGDPTPGTISRVPPFQSVESGAIKERSGARSSDCPGEICRRVVERVRDARGCGAEGGRSNARK